jgi:hypothetical protein
MSTFGGARGSTNKKGAPLPAAVAATRQADPGGLVDLLANPDIAVFLLESLRL